MIVFYFKILEFVFAASVCIAVAMLTFCFALVYNGKRDGFELAATIKLLHAKAHCCQRVNA
jgi:hypothetical protein